MDEVLKIDFGNNLSLKNPIHLKLNSCFVLYYYSIVNYLFYQLLQTNYEKKSD